MHVVGRIVLTARPTPTTTTYYDLSGAFAAWRSGGAAYCVDSSDYSSDGDAGDGLDPDARMAAWYSRADGAAV